MLSMKHVRDLMNRSVQTLTRTTSCRLQTRRCAPARTVPLFSRIDEAGSRRRLTLPALVHESELARNDPAHAGHLPIAYDAGLPR
jgi:hypothetical protein